MIRGSVKTAVKIKYTFRGVEFPDLFLFSLKLSMPLSSFYKSLAVKMCTLTPQVAFLKEIKMYRTSLCFADSGRFD